MAPSTTSVQCFGKLPIAGDFIRYRLDDDETKAFVAWVEKGQALVEAIRRGYRPLPGRGVAREGGLRRYRFALDLGLGRRIVVGILHESHDKGKLRRFPFALFTTVDAAGFRSRPGLMPIVLAEMWGAMEARVGNLQEAADSQALFRKLEESDIPAMETPGVGTADLERRLQTARAGDFWTRLFGPGYSERRLLLFDMLIRAVQPSVQARPEGATAILKLPLAGAAEDVRLQSAFWTDLLAGIFSGTRKAPSLFLAAPEASGPAESLYVFFQKPDERCFAALMNDAHEAEHVDDLTQKLSFGRRGPVLGREHRRLLERDEASLRDIAEFRWL